jgi:hypothetical protein
MRKDAVFAVLLNVTLFRGMSCTIAQDPRYLRFSVLTPSGAIHYNLRVRFLCLHRQFFMAKPNWQRMFFLGGLGGKRTGGYRSPESNQRQHPSCISLRVIHYCPYNFHAFLFFYCGWTGCRDRKRDGFSNLMIHACHRGPSITITSRSRAEDRVECCVNLKSACTILTLLLLSLLLPSLLEQKVLGQLLSLVALSIYTPPTADTYLPRRHMWLKGLVSCLRPALFFQRYVQLRCISGIHQFREDID